MCNRSTWNFRTDKADLFKRLPLSTTNKYYHVARTAISQTTHVTLDDDEKQSIVAAWSIFSISFW